MGMPEDVSTRIRTAWPFGDYTSITVVTGASIGLFGSKRERDTRPAECSTVGARRFLHQSPGMAIPRLLQDDGVPKHQARGDGWQRKNVLHPVQQDRLKMLP
jgi:hypothetical protein